VLARVVLGPLCDRYGPKAMMSSLLLVGSVPVFCMMRVQSWQGEGGLWPSVVFYVRCYVLCYISKI
jgi:nitrate/nitrite transporter NarK